MYGLKITMAQIYSHFRPLFHWNTHTHTHALARSNSFNSNNVRSQPSSSLWTEFVQLLPIYVKTLNRDFILVFFIKMCLFRIYDIMRSASKPTPKVKTKIQMYKHSSLLQTVPFDWRSAYAPTLCYPAVGRTGRRHIDRDDCRWWPGALCVCVCIMVRVILHTVHVVDWATIVP